MIRSIRETFRRRERLLILIYLSVVVSVCLLSIATCASWRLTQAVELAVAHVHRKSIERWRTRYERAVGSCSTGALAALVNEIPFHTPRSPVAQIRFDGLRSLSQLHVANGNTAAAVTTYKTLIHENRGVAEDVAALGELLLRLGRRAEGETQLQRALEMDPHCMAALKPLVGHWMQAHRYREVVGADQRYEQAFAMASGRLDDRRGLRLWCGDQPVGRWTILPVIDGTVHPYRLPAARGLAPDQDERATALTLDLEPGPSCATLEIRSITLLGPRDVRRDRSRALVVFDAFDQAQIVGARLDDVVSRLLHVTEPLIQVTFPISPGVSLGALDVIEVTLVAGKRRDAIVDRQVALARAVLADDVTRRVVRR